MIPNAFFPLVPFLNQQRLAARIRPIFSIRLASLPQEFPAIMLLRVPLLLTLFLSMTGCGSAPTTPPPQTYSATLNPAEAVAQAEQNLELAVSRNMDFFAPLNLKKARESIQSARQKLQSPSTESQQDALKSAIAAEDFLALAYQTKALVETHLKSALDHKAILDELNAKDALPDDYSDVVDELIDLIKMIEKDDLGDAIEDQPDVLAQMTLLEINTLLKQHMSKALEWLDKADDIDADDYAEITFQTAEETTKTSNSFIRSNFRDRDGVKRAGISALLASQRAYFVAQESKRIVDLDKEQAERHALEDYAMLSRAYKKATDRDLPPQELSTAAEALFNAVPAHDATLTYPAESEPSLQVEELK